MTVEKEVPEVQEGKSRGPCIEPLRSAQFAVLFNDLFAAATEEVSTDMTPLTVLEKHGFDVDLPPNLSRRLGPLLGRRVGAIDKLAASECGACGICGVCAACGEINLGAPGAAAAAIWAIL
jgi:hypothetical protein